jgi:hypothetical protein
MSAKLDEMWAALEAYQPTANADGHGESWRVMCRERTTEATRWAYYVADYYVAEGSAADAAWYAYSALFVARHRSTDYHAQRAIDAIKEVKP